MISRALKTMSGAARSFIGTNALSASAAESLTIGEHILKANAQLLQRIVGIEEKQEELLNIIHELGARLENPAAGSQSEFSFVSLFLPNGKEYELSVDEENPDVFHQAVASGGTSDTNWRFIINWIRAGDVFFDVGANIGTISIPAALSGATVHSFELLTSNVQHLLRSTERNATRNMSLVLGAVSDKHVPAGVGGSSAWGTVVPISTLSVAAVVLDVYADSRGLETVDFMKIDVEGSELAALRGSVEIIKKFSPDIVIEGNVVTSANAGYSYKEILAFLADHGYEIFRVHSDRLIPWNPSETQEVIFVDYFATAKSRTEVEERSGWVISTMAYEEIIKSIELQDLMPPLHKQYVLAVAKQLPAQVAADPRVAMLLEKWHVLDDDSVRKTLQIGAR